jgi:hypothetical protein
LPIADCQSGDSFSDRRMTHRPILDPPIGRMRRSECLDATLGHRSMNVAIRQLAIGNGSPTAHLT